MAQKRTVRVFLNVRLHVTVVLPKAIAYRGTHYRDCLSCQLLLHAWDAAHKYREPAT